MFVLQISPTGTIQIKEKQKSVGKIRVNELNIMKDLLQRPVREQEVSVKTVHNLSNNKVICRRINVNIDSLS